MRPGFSRLCAAALLSVCCLSGAAEPERRYTFSFQKVPLRQAVERICKETGVSCQVAPDVADLPVSMSLRGADPWSALRIVARHARPDLGLTRSGDRMVVRALAVEEQERDYVRWEIPDPRLERRLTFSLGNVSLRQAWARVFRDSQVDAVIEAAVPDPRVSLKAENETAFVVLHRLVGAAQAVVPELLLERDRGLYILSMRPERRAADPAALAPLRQKKIAVSFKDLPLRDAVGKIFTGSGLMFAVHSNVPNLNVSLNVKDGTLEDALRALIRGVQEDVPDLTLGRDGDVSVLERRGTTPPAPKPGAL